MTIAIWVPLRQAKFDFNIIRDIGELINDIRDIFVQLSKVAVHDRDRAVHLFLADIFRPIVMNDVEDNGDDDEFIAVEVLEFCGLLFEPFSIPFRLSSELRMSLKKGLGHLPLATKLHLCGGGGSGWEII